MNYAQFICEIQKMGTGFPIPTLNGKSRKGRICFFTVNITNGILYIRNNYGTNTPREIDENFYKKVLDRFENAPSEYRFSPSYYARKGSTSVYWSNRDGNPDAIYAGYLPSLFRELYTRQGVSVSCNDKIWAEIDLPSELEINVEPFSAVIDGLSSILSLEPMHDFCKKHNINISKDACGKVVCATFGGKTVPITRANFCMEFKLVCGTKFQTWFAKFTERKYPHFREFLERLSVEVIISIIVKALGL